MVNAFNFYDGGPYRTKTSPLIFRANEWTGFYIIETSIMKELKANVFKV